jgi:hypothetical protein
MGIPRCRLISLLDSTNGTSFEDPTCKRFSPCWFTINGDTQEFFNHTFTALMSPSAHKVKIWDRQGAIG